MIRGYHKPIMVAGGLGNVRRQNVEKKEVVVGAPLIVLGGPSMLIGLGRRSRLVGRQRAEFLRSGFRLGAARQCGNSAAGARSHRPLRGLGRCESHSADSRCRRRRIVERPARGHRAQPARRPHRLAQDSQRRVGTLADGDLVQRGAGALRAGAACRERPAIRRRCASASAAPLPWWARSPATACCRSPIPLLHATPVDMPIEVLLGKAPRMTRDVHTVRQALLAALHRRHRD